MNRPWTRTWVDDLCLLSEWYPEAMVAWDELLQKITVDWPVMFYARGHVLSADDARCFSTQHTEHCRCYCWLGDEWRRWLPDR